MHVPHSSHASSPLFRKDHGIHSARADAEGLYVHAFVAYAHAAEAENAARRIVIDQRRPFLLGSVEFFLDETGLVEAVAEGHVLQFALAAFVANGAIERMVREQELDHVLASAMDLIGIGFDYHAVGGHRVQAVWSFGIFSTSTRHMRQAAWSERPG